MREAQAGPPGLSPRVQLLLPNCPLLGRHDGLLIKSSLGPDISVAKTFATLIPLCFRNRIRQLCVSKLLVVEVIRCTSSDAEFCHLLIILVDKGMRGLPVSYSHIVV